MFRNPKWGKLILSLLLFMFFASQAVCGQVRVNQPGEGVVEGDITLTMYPDGSVDVSVSGSSEQVLDPWRSPPFRGVVFELANSPVEVNLTECSGTLVVEFGPEMSEMFMDMDLDIAVHADERSAEATVLFDMPGYVGLEGRVGFEAEEATTEGTLDLEATVRIWYTLYPKEYIELFIETFPMLKGQMLSELSRMTDGMLEAEEMTIVDSELGQEMAAITLRVSIVGDFAEGLQSLVEEAYIPYLDLPDTKPRIDFREAMITKIDSADVRISFDGDERELTISFDGVVDGDIDRQVNVVKNLLIEETVRDFEPDPETAEMINEFLLPTEMSVQDLNATLEYSYSDEVQHVYFALNRLGMKPPTAEALLNALQGASEEVSEPGFTLTLEGGSEGRSYVEIVVPPTASEPLVEEPGRVIWAFDDIENLNQVTFEVKETKGPSMLTPQVLIPAAGAAVVIAVAAFMLTRR